MVRLPMAVLTGLTFALAGSALADGPMPQLRPAGSFAVAEPPLTPPGDAEPSVNSLPTTASDAVPQIAGAAQYRLFREGDAQCRAARAAWLANLLDRERAHLMKEHPPATTHLDCLLNRDAKAWELRRTILYYSALDDRNRAAGRSLEAFFRAAELEAQVALLNLTHNELNDAILKADDLKKKGFRLPVDIETLQRQRLEAESDLTRARAGLVTVNARLKEMTGLAELPVDHWLWPAIEVPVTFEPIDIDAAIAVAMSKRPELLLLRVLSHDLDAQTTPVVREYLHSVSGMIGAGGPVKHLAATLAMMKGGEQGLRTRQIGDLLAEREKAVAEEVRLAIIDLHAKTKLVALSRDRVRSADANRQDAEKKSESGSGSFLEVLNARMEWYKARNQLTMDVMAWHVARSKVRLAQGVLVWECCGGGA